MPHLMPGAQWLPISRNFTRRKRAKTRGVILHVDAGNAASLGGWFNNPQASASSHLFVKSNGTIEQYVDLDLIAWTSGTANGETIGIETQGYGDGQWSDKQLASLAKILAYLSRYYRFPLRAMASSRSSEAGIGWHALGVAASTAQKSAGISQTGGALWSSSVGKICPGPARIKQIPSIISAATAANQPAAHAPARPKGIKMLMIALPKGAGSKTLYSIFGPGFWLEFTGQTAANTFIRQIGAIPAKALIVDRAFWISCKKAATTGKNA